METVADHNECEQLYRLSGWKGCYWFWEYRQHLDGSGDYYLAGEHDAPFGTSTIPAYDVAFLMQRLPSHDVFKAGNGTYVARWMDYTSQDGTIERSSRSNPANALCRLAIALYEEGILGAKQDAADTN